MAEVNDNGCHRLLLVIQSDGAHSAPHWRTDRYRSLALNLKIGLRGDGIGSCAAS